MVAWLESLSTGAAALVIVGGFVLVTLTIGYLIGTFTSREVRMAHNDLGGFILAVVGVIYAVLLAFVAIGVWERFQFAEARTYEEAGALMTVYRDAESFPDGAPVRLRLRAYVHSVITDEWPRMQRGQQSLLSDRLLESIDRSVRSLSVPSARLANVHAQMLAAMNTALTDREARLTLDFSGINGLLWFVLVTGAALTVGFTYLFGFQRTVMQQLMIGFLGTMIGLVLFLVVALDYPYRGSIAVPPEAFHGALDAFNIIGP